MNKNPVTFLFFCLLIAVGCSEKEVSPIINPSLEIELDIEKSNSDNNYTSKAVEISTKSKSSGWQVSNDGIAQLTREIMFDLTLENGEKLEFGFWLIKYETDTSLLDLIDADLYYRARRWNYKSLEDEKEKFYGEFDEARVLVNSNVIFYEKPDQGFEVSSVKSATIDGESKSYLTIRFSGTAFGWYDPEGAYQEVYSLNNGVFSGAIE